VIILQNSVKQMDFVVDTQQFSVRLEFRLQYK